ncbi:amylo-alpha-1,6-glucosidase [Lignipirellula cremea]|uniref:Amylo-alpha-1,6-glucosidase n=1 Tax=Lignipirellula cremea TaxID=2528010 RepID=A0A518E4I2_9BACT|nr:amylo-alpha-1,6-glucosidase [Lignipirellula cremea]QDU98990.1 Amylo-alpha-1,6-glucosidase [Lignipirellula cremea]
MTLHESETLAEWIETDGLGGFASGTVRGQRTRRYHALLLAARNPPADRLVLVNGMDVWAQTPGGTYPLSTQVYQGEVESPRGQRFLSSFTAEPWPVWRYALTEEVTVVLELLVAPGVPGTAMRWSVEGKRDGVSLHVRPFLSGRDFHGTHHANDVFQQATRRQDVSLVWQPYGDLPEIHVQTNAAFEESFQWYYGFLYTAEQERGLDALEDLASPGEFHADLSSHDACLLLSVDRPFSELCGSGTSSALETFALVAAKERLRREATGAESCVAGSYLVNRGEGKTVIAGYPWFGDWGRDTFIAMRGLCLTDPAGLPHARAILTGWADAVSEGMLPNRFPDQGTTPEFNSVDASLWYVIAVGEYLEASRQARQTLPAAEIQRLQQAVESILQGYAAGTRYGIRLDDDGLVAAGEPGVQLTWMDAKVGDWVVTPRIGKPVEIQALWLSALHIAGQFSDRWTDRFQQGKASFVDKFWNADRGCLFDVVDDQHEAGRVDDAMRPNQIFAVGGLPLVLLDDAQATSLVAAVEEKLLTPVGLRSLSPDHPAYQPHYQGDVRQRDGAYHQGTVWPWLIGPFVEAWLRVRRNSPAAKAEAAVRFLEQLQQHLAQAGLGHLSEICDGDAPHTPRGCPFQAWSYGEYLRIKRRLLTRR